MADPRDAEIARLRSENAELRAQVAELQKVVEELRALLARDSTNSSLPPSKDDPEGRRKRRAKAANNAKRRQAKASRKKNRGAKRELVAPELVTSSEDHWPTSCACCGDRLDRRDVEGEPDRVQHFELPRLRPDVHEFRMHTLRCNGCGESTKAKYPGEARGPSFGPNLRALITLLIARFRMSRRDVVEYLGDVLHVPASPALISKMERHTTAALEAPYQEAKAAVQQARVVHADETSWSYGGIPGWLWVAATGELAVFRIDDKRGKQAAISLLGSPDRPDRVIVVDRWTAYDGFVQRQACWAHLERSAIALAERKDAGKAVGDAILDFIKKMFSLWHRFLDGQITRRGLACKVKGDGRRLIARWRARAGGLPKDARRLIDGLHVAQPYLFTFTEVEGVEPTNNLAERELRRGVMWRRTSFATRTERGRRFVERTLTVVVSLRAQGRDIFDFLRCALDPKSQTPSLLPD